MREQWPKPSLYCEELPRRLEHERQVRFSCAGGIARGGHAIQFPGASMRTGPDDIY